MLVEKGCRVARHVSGERTVSVGWSLGLLFDHRGGDYPQSMLKLVSPYELKESKPRYPHPHVSTYSRIAFSFFYLSFR